MAPACSGSRPTSSISRRPRSSSSPSAPGRSGGGSIEANPCASAVTTPPPSARRSWRPSLRPTATSRSPTAMTRGRSGSTRCSAILRDAGARLRGDYRYRCQLPGAGDPVACLWRDLLPSAGPHRGGRVRCAGILHRRRAARAHARASMASSQPRRWRRRSMRIRSPCTRVQPAALSISQATELGTGYRPAELAALCDRSHTPAACACTWTARASPMR